MLNLSMKQMISATYLKVNLNKIRENYITIKSQINPNCEIAAVVKANAYGIGAKQVVKTLADIGCSSFCVSHVEEAIDMPRDVTTYVLHGINSKDDAKLAIELGVVPVLNHLKQIEIWNSIAKSKEKILPALLQVDIGMGRFGLSNSEFQKLINNHNYLSNIKLTHLVGHMSCAEQTNHPLNSQQLLEFKNYLNYFPETKASLANSAGIFLGSDFHFDMVRPGCALYGINPTSLENNPMEHVVELQGYIVQKRIIDKDQFIGYRAQYKANAGEKLFIVECGYADGYVRALSNKGICYVAGYYLPVVGVISMDATIVSAASLPEQYFNEATHAEMLGNHITIDDVARYANTISYEILTTRFGNRCKRFYISE